MHRHRKFRHFSSIAATLVGLWLDPASIVRAAESRVVQVGPTHSLKTPSMAAAQAKDGDTIEIDAGDYPSDVAVWSANHLTLRGVRGMAHLAANGNSAQKKAIWVIRGNDTVVESVEFSGCKVPDRNGAGIRQEGRGLVVRHCCFHGNENGILTGANPESDILIENSEFHHSGFGDGYSHNLYIGQVRSFTMRFCSSHHAKTGHLVKSRAQSNFILYNRLMDEQDGSSSYVIDLPNGGRSFIIGNILQHGPRAENGTMVSYAAEGPKNTVQELYVVNNTGINERRPAGGFLKVSGNPATVRVVNNLVTGAATLLSGSGETTQNLLTESPGFLDAAHYDYTLSASSPALHGGMDPGKAGDFGLTQEFYYHHPLAGVPFVKDGKPHLGACPANKGASGPR
ncbi:MAG: right-handed parallel beta-helix repeat-containing protein [Verrucomicrobiota bacterium]